MLLLKEIMSSYFKKKPLARLKSLSCRTDLAIKAKVLLNKLTRSEPKKKLKDKRL